MFNLFWRQQKKLEELLREYFAKTDQCFDFFSSGMNEYFERGRGEVLSELVQKTHRAESQADALRREIELTLYSQSLLPESRGDILGLLEQFDRIPNRAETCLHMIECQALDLPEELIQQTRQLVELNVEAYNLTRQAIDALFHSPKMTPYYCSQVIAKESESDHHERKLIRKIFKELPIDAGEKVLYKELVLAIGSISDRCETTSDRISIVAIKRQI